jgi:hypothetical protein
MPLARHDDIKVIYETTLPKVPARDGDPRDIAQHVPLRAVPRNDQILRCSGARKFPEKIRSVSPRGSLIVPFVPEHD